MDNSFRSVNSAGHSENQPQASRVKQQSGLNGGTQDSSSNNKGSRAKKNLVRAIIGLVVLALVLLGAYAAHKHFSQVQPDDGYQAVFLTNGQVYFGKLHNTNGDYLKLSNIFYLQADQPLQAETESANGDSAEAVIPDDENIQLIKLGDELHGPKDQMQISYQQVLFWENLKADGKVAEAIDSYKSE